jgi:hypothetical protein
MLGNIIDSRKNKYAATRLNIVMEPSAHDNSIEGADQHSWKTGCGDCDVYYNVTLGEAIAKAIVTEGAVTVFLYDIDVDPMAITTTLEISVDGNLP